MASDLLKIEAASHPVFAPCRLRVRLLFTSDQVIAFCRLPVRLLFTGWLPLTFSVHLNHSLEQIPVYFDTEAALLDLHQAFGDG